MDFLVTNSIHTITRMQYRLWMADKRINPVMASLKKSPPVMTEITIRTEPIRAILNMDLAFPMIRGAWLIVERMKSKNIHGASILAYFPASVQLCPNTIPMSHGPMVSNMISTGKAITVDVLRVFMTGLSRFPSFLYCTEASL